MKSNTRKNLITDEDAATIAASWTEEELQLARAERQAALNNYLELHTLIYAAEAAKNEERREQGNGFSLTNGDLENAGGEIMGVEGMPNDSKLIQLLNVKVGEQLPETVVVDIPTWLYSKAAIFHGKDETTEDYIEACLDFGIRGLI